MDVGLSFSPTTAGAQQSAMRGPSNISPVQDAIRILSFRLPTVLGAGAATPMQNLGAPSIFGSQLGSSVIQNFLRSLYMPSAGGQGSPYDSLFGQAGASGQAMPDRGYAPLPSIMLNNQRPPTGGSPDPMSMPSLGAPSMTTPQAPPSFIGGIGGRQA